MIPTVVDARTPAGTWWIDEGPISRMGQIPGQWLGRTTPVALLDVIIIDEDGAAMCRYLGHWVGPMGVSGVFLPSWTAVERVELPGRAVLDETGATHQLALAFGGGS